jgi:hypothetical protein
MYLNVGLCDAFSHLFSTACLLVMRVNVIHSAGFVFVLSIADLQDWANPWERLHSPTSRVDLEALMD